MDVPGPQGPAVATALLRRDLARARLLQETLAEHVPAARLVVVVVDDALRTLGPDDEPFEVHHVEDLLPDEEVAALRAGEEPDALLAAAIAALLAVTGPAHHLPVDAVVVGPLDPARPEVGWHVPDAGDPVHANDLARHGHATFGPMPAGIGILALPGYVGDLVRAAFERYAAATPLDARSTEDFLEWCRAPDPSLSGARHGVGRLLRDVWSVRPDLAAHLPDLDGEDGPLLIEWAWRFGVEFDGMPAALLPPRPPASALGRALEDPPTPTRTVRAVNVVGLLERELGLGEAARNLVLALDAADVPVLPIEARCIQGARYRADAAGSALELADATFPVNVVCLNGDAFAHVVEVEGADRFAERPTVGLWFWEVGPPPSSWFEQIHLLDEVWVASTFVAEQIAPSVPVPVAVVPQPLVVSPAAPLDRAGYGIDPDAFVFLFVFDFNSDLERKNPLGLIEAYVRAFPTTGAANLVLKSINGENHPRARDLVRLAASRRPDIRLIEGALPVAERDALLAGCDCYVSLHRSEGFGLTMAEAMAHGRPVIATRYGGNVDFMDDDTAWLVDGVVAEVGDGSVYAGSGSWLDPDLDRAAAAMREVALGGDGVAARARAGQERVARDLSPVAIGSKLVALLERQWAAVDGRPDDPRLGVDARRAAATVSTALAQVRAYRRRVDELTARLGAMGG